MKKQALGRGLSALIPENNNTGNFALPKFLESRTPDGQAKEIPLTSLIAGPFQPRKNFDEEAINQLADSIREKGVLQPIIVRKTSHPDTPYQIIAGERRMRASKKVGLTHIPVIIKDISDSEALELALIENIQRQDLGPIEEAEGYKRLQDEFNYTQETLAKHIGKSRSHIANMLRLNQLPDEVKGLMRAGGLSMGHARAIINKDNVISLAHKIVKDKLSVRDVEKITSPKNKTSSKQQKKPTVPLNKSIDFLELEQTLSEKTGLKIQIDSTDEEGEVVIRFHGLSELDKILQILNK